MGLTAPSLLTPEHSVSGFHCGITELDVWLTKRALKSQHSGTARVYVVTDSGSEAVVGYYAIAMGSVQRAQAFSALRRNSPDPIPMVILARLGVHEQYHGLGIGAGLLKDCVLRSVQAMHAVGGAGILVHAIDDEARRFYQHFGFTESTFDPLVLMARVRDIEAALKG